MRKLEECLLLVLAYMLFTSLCSILTFEYCMDETKTYEELHGWLAQGTEYAAVVMVGVMLLCGLVMFICIHLEEKIDFHDSRVKGPEIYKNAKNTLGNIAIGLFIGQCMAIAMIISAMLTLKKASDLGVALTEWPERAICVSSIMILVTLILRLIARKICDKLIDIEDAAAIADEH